jgi:hypothetical protein
MAISRAQFTVEARSTADPVGLDIMIAKLHGQIEATEKLGKSTKALEKQLAELQQSKIEAELAGITGQTQKSGDAAKEAAGAVEKLGLNHRQLHGVLEQVAPNLAGIIRYLTSGFAGAIGLTLVAFEFLNQKLDQFNKFLDEINTGPGARGEWAEKMAENERNATVEAAVLEERLRVLATAQETLTKRTDEAVAALHRQFSDTKEVADAQKAVDLARLALEEKLGEITPDQAVLIRLQIDDAAFERELEAKKAEIKAELTVRLNEQDSLRKSQETLKGPKEAADAAALAAENAKTKNEAKLAQDKKDLDDLRAVQKQLQEGMQLKDIVPQWSQKFASRGSMVDIAASSPEQIDRMVAQKMAAVRQEEGKGTGLAVDAAVTKQKAQEADAAFEDNIKAVREMADTIRKLNGDLEAQIAKNAALGQLHNQASAATAAGVQHDIMRKVGAGQGTQSEREEVAAWQAQRTRTLPAETRGLINEANNALNAGRTGEISFDEIHAVLERIIGHHQAGVKDTAQMKQRLQDLERKLDDLEGSYLAHRGGRD